MDRLSTSWYSEIPEETDTRSKFDQWVEGDLPYSELSQRDKKFADRLLNGKKKSVNELSTELKGILDELDQFRSGAE